MAVSIVKVPQCAAGDMDFLAFSFNGKHSWDDFHIYRTSDGDRYDENLTLTLADKTAEVPGGDGMYYFGTTHGQRDFNISFAFDSLTEVQLRELKKWLNGKEMGDLWFQEAPYKVWTAKPTGNSSIKYIPFDDFDKQGNKIRVYKGEGSVQFVAYWPYAHTPDFVEYRDPNVAYAPIRGDGKKLSSYTGFYNKDEWAAASGLDENVDIIKGDLPTTFIAEFCGNYGKDSVLGEGEKTITLLEACKDPKWDSKTGIVSGKIIEGGIEKERAIKVSGKTVNSFKPGENSFTIKTKKVYTFDDKYDQETDKDDYTHISISLNLDDDLLFPAEVSFILKQEWYGTDSYQSESYVFEITEDASDGSQKSGPFTIEWGLIYHEEGDFWLDIGVQCDPQNVEDGQIKKFEVDDFQVSTLLINNAKYHYWYY